MIHSFPEDFIYDGPCRFTDPFRYMPCSAVRTAAKLIMERIGSNKSLAELFSEGKMLGVMVCKRNEGYPLTSEQLCFIAAFSGNVGGKSSIDGFVPPIYDLTSPDGEYKRKEAEISALNERILFLLESSHIKSLYKALSDAELSRENEIAQMRIRIQNSRNRRNELRATCHDSLILDSLIKESQFEKAEFKRLKHQWENRINKILSSIDEVISEIDKLKKIRASMSEKLQDWIFRQYIVHNFIGEKSSIASIFATSGLIPPGGTGECAAPKLLEYAWRNHLQPLAMGEFWYGNSPDTAVRTHGHFYPSCTSKCGPLLGFMLKGLNIHKEDADYTTRPYVTYEDNAIIIVEKPPGMPSVTGLDNKTSLNEWLEKRNGAVVHTVHRLDMDTSGIMVYGKTHEAAVNLRRQFEAHSVKKTYIARVGSRDWSALKSGIKNCIDLPLSADYDERPRQKVDFSQGKDALTEYEVISVNEDGTVDLKLHPKTGRTHQLRVHCAHKLGLGSPILGDRLYGGAEAERLFLHAYEITFIHPSSDQKVTYSSTKYSWQ